jgi:hypothetical protein
MIDIKHVEELLKPSDDREGDAMNSGSVTPQVVDYLPDGVLS